MTMTAVNRKSMRYCFGLWLGALVFSAVTNARAEIVFQDFFTQPATNITNSVPWIDVEGNGWQCGAANSLLALDGSGHLYNSATSAGATAGVQLIPIGPHGSMTASATIQLPVGFNEWIGMGFGNSNQFLTATASASGPWIQVFSSGTITLYGGTALSNPLTMAGAFTNTGGPTQIFLTYDAFRATASAGTVSGGVTNLIFNQFPVTNTLNDIAAKYLLFQFSTNLTTPTARWATAATVDWLPRPLPMVALPVPVLRTNFIGSPGTNDLLLISNAFNLVSGSNSATEIRFTAGAMYVITNSSLTSSIPLMLFHATNVLVNGNGCKILITNPRIGFLSVNNSSNIIVQGFSIDYSPLPFTQGVVTHNFYTSNDSPKESAIEFTVDAGYPAPTNANYVDPNANRWGMVIDPTRPGRVGDGSYTQIFYTNVIQTNTNGAFKVYLTDANRTQTIQPGNLWCMISRWDGSIGFNTSLSTQVTYQNNTNYTGAGLVYVGERSSLVCEINDQILPGTPPVGATAPRRRASNGDGGLFVESRIGPWVQGCAFTALSDDIANVCMAPFIITNAPPYPTNTFAVYENTVAGAAPMSLVPFQVQVGDAIIFFNATNGVVFDHATITAVELPNITFDHTITNIVPGNYTSNTMLINETLNTSAVYLDNQFLDSGFHGIYCRANNVLIAHNTVGGMGKNAICAFPAITTAFLNFFVPTNVVIMDNVLSDEGFSYEAVNNNIPNQQPAYAMIALHKADTASDYVSNGFEISGIRVLYNAFLNWHRAPLTLHNATDVNVIGNYFGPPATNDGLVPLTNNVIADLWASDYPNLRFTNNVNGSTLPNSQTIVEDGTPATITNAFQLPTAPRLAANLSGTNLLVSWVSPSPGFTLQQINKLVHGANNWVDATNAALLAGQSNIVTFPLSPQATNVFFRTRQQ
jgi:hypothetical protein